MKDLQKYPPKKIEREISRDEKKSKSIWDGAEYLLFVVL